IVAGEEREAEVVAEAEVDRAVDLVQRLARLQELVGAGLGLAVLVDEAIGHSDRAGTLEVAQLRRRRPPRLARDEADVVADQVGGRDADARVVAETGPVDRREADAEVDGALVAVASEDTGGVVALEDREPRQLAGGWRRRRRARGERRRGRAGQLGE